MDPSSPIPLCPLPFGFDKATPQPLYYVEPLCLSFLGVLPRAGVENAESRRNAEVPVRLRGMRQDGPILFSRPRHQPSTKVKFHPPASA